MSVLHKRSFLLSEPFQLFSLLAPLAYLTTFLLVPLAIPLIELFQANPILIAQLVFRNPRYFSLEPLGSLVEVRDVAFGGKEFTLILLKGVSFGSLANSFLLASVSTIVTTLLGTIVAVLLTFYEFPGRRVMRILAIVPLFAAPFASGYVVRKFFDWRYGVLAYIVNDVLGIPVRIGLESFAGVLVAQMLSLYVIVYLNVSAAISNIDHTLIEQAQNLGSSTLRILRKVVLPLSAPGIAAGASLVFILSIEDVANPIIFKEDRLIAYEIFRSFMDPTTGTRSPAALFMTVILIAVSMTIFLGVRRYVSLRRYASVGRGVKPFRPFKLSRGGVVAVYVFLVPFLALASVPQVGVVVLALSTRWFGPLPEGFTLNNFASIVQDPIVFTAVRNSLTYSSVGLAVIAFMAMFVGYASSRTRGFLSYLVDTLATLPVAIPGIAVASSYFLLFTRPPFKGSLFDPVIFSPGVAITIAYTVRRLPFMVRAVYAGMQQMAPEMEDAAVCLGASRLRAFATVVLPLLTLYVFGGSIMTFVYCLSETSVGVMLGGLRGVAVGHAAPITFVMQDYLDRLHGPQIVGALGAFLVILQLLATVVATVALKGSPVIGVR